MRAFVPPFKSCCRLISLSGHRKLSMLSFQSIPVPFAIGSAVVAYLAYRKYAKGDRDDLGSEVCKERESLCSVIAALPEQLDLAKRSRIALAETKGLLGSEAMQQWLNELEVDLAEAKLLESELPAADTEATNRSGMELHIRLVEILALSIRANGLVDKYRLWLSADNSDPEGLLDQPESLPEPPRTLQPSM